VRTIDYDGTKLIIKFYVPTYEFQKTVDLVKACEGRNFDPAKKRWTAFPTQENISLLVANNFIASPKVKTLWKDAPIFIDETIPLADIDASKLDKRLFPYQFDGVRWLEAHKGSGVIGLPVGLGKSNIAASYGRLHPEDRPILIVCPACVKYNWQREVKKWAGEEAMVLSGKTVYRLNTHYKWVIINYDILKEWADTLVEAKFKYLIGDESAYVNNPSTYRTKAFIRLARVIPKRVLLSATPIRNRPSEFFTALNLVDRKLFPNRKKYLDRYCEPKFNGYSWTYKGLTNEEELFHNVQKVMFRRRKEDVLSDLPDKRKIIVPFALDSASQKKYDKASASFKNWVQTLEATKALSKKAHIETLRQLAYVGKRDEVIEWVENFLESGEKLVVFAYHTEAIDDLANAFGKEAVVVDGRTSSKQKQANIDAFQNDSKVRLFIGQTTAAGVGITLTAASSMAVVEFPWTPGDLEQMFGRIDRIGQEAKMLSYYFLVGAGTVDEDTALLLDEKSKMLDKTLDGHVTGDIFGMSIEDMLCNLYTKGE